MAVELVTERLRLRQWQPSDHAPFRAMNADPEVMRYFPRTLTMEESDQRIDDWAREIDARGWGFWAVELISTYELVGCLGLTIPRHPLPFTPCVEIGWRLARCHWKKGYATEGARGALRYGFETLNLPEIVSFTALINKSSRAVMERIGMINAGEDFDHPVLEEGSPLRRHCLYRIDRERWLHLARR